MLTRVYICLFAFLITLGVWDISTASAQKYTTRSNRASASSSSSSELEKCTAEDVKAIKKFNPRVKRAIKKMTMSEGIENENRAIKEAKKALKFFTSEEYEYMKKVYIRCGREMPTHKHEPPFWVPEHLGGNTDTCPWCPKK